MGLLVVSREAAAQGPRYALHWVRAKGAERCIGPKALAARVEALTGPLFVAPAQAEVSLEGEIAPARRGFRVRLVNTAQDGRQAGERVLSSQDADCRQLDAAVAFVIALTVNPDLVLDDAASEVLGRFAQEIPPEQALLAELDAAPKPASDAPAPSVAPTPATPESAPEPPPSPPSDPPKARFEVGAALASLGRTLPGWPLGARALFGLAHPGFVPLVLSADAFPHASRALAGGRRLDFQGYQAGVSVCPELGFGRLSGRVCLGLGLAYLSARGSGFQTNQRTGIWDPALLFGPSLALTLGRGVAIAADALLRLRMTNQRFVWRDANEVTQAAYTPSRLGLLFSFGPRYEF